MHSMVQNQRFRLTSFLETVGRRLGPTKACDENEMLRQLAKTFDQASYLH